MTEEMKMRTEAMREGGLGYVRIAQALGISVNTVRSYCQTQFEKGTKEKHLCLYCGKPVKQNPGCKEKKFCSDVCRMKWWHDHVERMNRKATYELVCPASTVASHSKRMEIKKENIAAMRAMWQTGLEAIIDDK